MKPKFLEQNFWYEFKEIKGAQWKNMIRYKEL